MLTGLESGSAQKTSYSTAVMKTSTLDYPVGEVLTWNYSVYSLPARARTIPRTHAVKCHFLPQISTTFLLQRHNISRTRKRSCQIFAAELLARNYCMLIAHSEQYFTVVDFTYCILYCIAVHGLSEVCLYPFKTVKPRAKFLFRMMTMRNTGIHVYV